MYPSMPIDVPIDAPIDGMCNTSAASLVDIDAPIDVDQLWHQGNSKPPWHNSRNPSWFTQSPQKDMNSMPT
jgi:hypothetical protein